MKHPHYVKIHGLTDNDAASLTALIEIHRKLTQDIMFKIGVCVEDKGEVKGLLQDSINATGILLYFSDCLDKYREDLKVKRKTYKNV